MTSCDDFVVRVHDASTGQVMRTLNPTTREHGVARVALRPDGRHLAAKDGDRNITIWDLETGEQGPFSQRD